MIVIFGAFTLSPQRLLQQVGFGMAVAIFVDAVVIRCRMVPAAMQLMGSAAWWMPGWLGRILPTVNIERSQVPSTSESTSAQEDPRIPASG